MLRFSKRRKNYFQPRRAGWCNPCWKQLLRRGPPNLQRYGAGALAGKTGTTNDNNDAWFVGYDSETIVAVWVGFDKGKPLGLTGSQARYQYGLGLW